MLSAVPSERAVLAALLVLFVCRAALVSTIVPPWQDPDSPTHFVLVRRLAMEDPPRAAVERLEAEVIASMAQYRWWEPYEQATPDPLPTSFRDMDFGRGTYDQPLYYALGHAALRMTAPPTLADAYWHLRVLSIGISTATLAMGWAGTRLLFGPSAALGALAVAVLFPQFVLAGIAVNPNVLAAFFGALAWWQVGRVARGRQVELSLALTVAAAVAALFTKRSAIPFAAGALVVGLALFARQVPRWKGSARRLVATAGVIAPLAIGAIMMLQTEGLVAYWIRTVNLVREIQNPVTPLEYTLASIDHTWFVAGWHRFLAPEGWRAAARVLTVVALAGAVVRTVERSPQRPFLAIAWVLVTAQILVVLAAGYWGFSVPHGRYAETVLAPMAALMWLGVPRLMPPAIRPYAGPALVAVLGVMNVSLVTRVLIPAYLPW